VRNIRRYLKPQFGCLRCSRRGCFVCFFLHGGMHYLNSVLAVDQVQTALSLLLLELSGYCVNAVRRHVYAADVLVRCGVDKEGFRYPPYCTQTSNDPLMGAAVQIWSAMHRARSRRASWEMCAYTGLVVCAKRWRGASWRARPVGGWLCARLAAQACRAGHIGGGLPVGCAGLSQDVADVVTDGLVGQVQPGGDGAV